MSGDTKTRSFRRSIGFVPASHSPGPYLRPPVQGIGPEYPDRISPALLAAAHLTGMAIVMGAVLGLTVLVAFGLKQIFS